jgi:hypothetical protein
LARQCQSLSTLVWHRSGSRDGTDSHITVSIKRSARGNHCEGIKMCSQSVEKKLWTADGLVMCRSCGGMKWIQTAFDYLPTGIVTSMLICKECYDICKARHTKEYCESFIMCDYQIAARNLNDEPQYFPYRTTRGHMPMAAMPASMREQPRLPLPYRRKSKT